MSNRSAGTSPGPTTTVQLKLTVPYAVYTSTVKAIEGIVNTAGGVLQLGEPKVWAPEFESLSDIERTNLFAAGVITLEDAAKLTRADCEKIFGPASRSVVALIRLLAGQNPPLKLADVTCMPSDQLELLNIGPELLKKVMAHTDTITGLAASGGMTFPAAERRILADALHDWGLGFTPISAETLIGDLALRDEGWQFLAACGIGPETPLKDLNLESLNKGLGKLKADTKFQVPFSPTRVVAGVRNELRAFGLPLPESARREKPQPPEKPE